MCRKLIYVISFVLVLSLAGSAQSAISVNFADGVILLDPADVAGAPGYASANWNNVTGISGTLAAGSVIDGTGAVVSGMEITWNAAFEWWGFPGTSGTASDKLMDFALISDPGTVSPSTITVTNIPYDEYYVVVYQISIYGVRGTEVSVVGHPDTYVSQPTFEDGVTSFDGTWLQVTSTDPFSPTVGGNYSVHAGLTGSTANISWTHRTEGGAPEWPWHDEGWVTGFQIIPEPATIALLGLGGLALLRRRKH